MDRNNIGVAISTTGDEHRLDLLVKSVTAWDACLPEQASLFVTVDGDEDDVARVADAVDHLTGSVYRVGQSWGCGPYNDTRDGRLGVAVNKNTGLELLMKTRADYFPINHLFLSDDDTWPLNPEALDLHTNLDLDHSMVCWGRNRQREVKAGFSSWSWPRGSVLYVNRFTVNQVGGMIEAFGPGGHEHVEWSRRIHQAGMTPALYPTPAVYADQHSMGARQFWHAEDMQRRGEPRATAISRRRHLTSVRRRDGDWQNIEKIMADRDGDTRFVPYAATDNGRESATLYKNH